MIDPPSGWKYGFPKEIPEGIEGQDLEQWLLDNGYPHDMIELGVEYYRYWYEDETT